MQGTAGTVRRWKALGNKLTDRRMDRNTLVSPRPSPARQMAAYAGKAVRDGDNNTGMARGYTRNRMEDPAASARTRSLRVLSATYARWRRRWPLLFVKVFVNDQVPGAGREHLESLEKLNQKIDHDEKMGVHSPCPITAWSRTGDCRYETLASKTFDSGQAVRLCLSSRRYHAV